MNRLALVVLALLCAPAFAQTVIKVAPGETVTVTVVGVEAPPPAPTCATVPKPADLTRPQTCPAGTTGSWSQAASYVGGAPYPTCWTLGAYAPTSAPADACKTIPVPPPTTGCAYPSFPDSSCTGFKPTGVTLTPYTGNCTITTAGTVLDSKLFSCSLTISADNVSIKRSQVNGVVKITNRAGLLIEDTLIDGQNQGVQCVGNDPNAGITAKLFTVRRSEMKRCTQGVYARTFVLEDSYIHELAGSGSLHTEGILATTGPITVKHSTILGEYNSAAGPFKSDGGMSSAVSFYTHGDFWPDIKGITFTQNYLRANSAAGRQAGYCLYGGASDDTGNTTNGVFKDNTFARGTSGKCASYGPVTWPASGAGSCWSNNKYDDGALIEARGVPACP